MTTPPKRKSAKAYDAGEPTRAATFTLSQSTIDALDAEFGHTYHKSAFVDDAVRAALSLGALGRLQHENVQLRDLLEKKENEVKDLICRFDQFRRDFVERLSVLSAGKSPRASQVRDLLKSLGLSRSDMVAKLSSLKAERPLRAAQVRDLRISLGLHRQEMAKLLGVSLPTYRIAETEGATRPKLILAFQNLQHRIAEQNGNLLEEKP